MHPTLTPLAADVDFRALAETYEASGGDIRNAVLKAAMAAASEPGGDASKAIHQRHLEAGIRDVLAGKRVMRQSLVDVPPRSKTDCAIPFKRSSTLFGGASWPSASPPASRWCWRWSHSCWR